MLIRETGEGVPAANSYADDGMAAEYCAARNIEWAASSTQAEAVLIRATDYIDTHYTFRSVREEADQSLEWPRYEITGLPEKLVRATIELAVIALKRDLFAIPDTRAITSQTMKSGTKEKTTSYQVSTVSDPFPQITKILSGVAARKSASASSYMVTL